MVHSYNESDKNHGGVFMKKIARNVLAFALALTMAVPLAACKKSGKGTKSSGSSGSKKKQTVIAEDDPYFDAVEIPIDIEVDKDKKLQYKEISEPIITGDRVLATYCVSYEIPKEVMDKFEKVDCNNKEEFAKAQEVFNQYNEMGTVVFDLDGNLISRTPASDMESSEGNITPLPDGTFVMVVGKTEEGSCKSKLEIVKLNEKLEETGTIEVSGELELAWDLKVTPLDNGNLVLADYTGIHIIDPNGKLLANESADGFTGMIFTVDGKIYELVDNYNSSSNEDEFYFQEIDQNTAKPVGDKIKTTYEAFSLIQGIDGCYVLGNSGLKRFDITTGTSGDLVLDWNWTDINSTNISSQNVKILSEDEMIFTKYTWTETEDPQQKVSGRDMSLVKFTRAPKNPHAGKSVIELGCMSVDGPFRDYVVDYNKAPEHVSRILISDYSDEIYSANQPYEDTVTELSDRIYLDMLSGEGPDILMNFFGLSQFNTEDILVDLNKFIDGQSGFNRDEYFDNIFRACEESGKLYQIPVCIDATGFAANPQLVGDRTSWTIEEFDQAVGSLPANVSLIQDTSKEDLLAMFLESDLASFIDNEKKEVSFDSEDFRKLLELSKKYGADKTVSGDVTYGMDMEMGPGMSAGYVGEEDKFAEGLVALMNVTIYGIEEYARLVNSVTFQPTFIGMPGPKAEGMSAMSLMSFAISAASDHQEEAWDFIRYLFDEDSQYKYSESFLGIPVSKNALTRKNEDDIARYNEYVEDYNKYIKEEGASAEGLKERTKITPEICDGYVKLIENITVIKTTDTSILAIIKEETASFFANQKPAEDVCKVIQNRATTKVHER